MLIPSEKPITEYTDNTGVSFGDYGHFEGSPKDRAQALGAFVAGKTYGVYTRYPKLDLLYDAGSEDDDLTVEEKKRRIQEAIYELTARRQSGEIRPEVADLYIASHNVRLKRIMLVEASRRVLYPGSSAEDEVARREYMFLNREVYGEMDQPMFEGIMHTEQERVDRFVPANDLARQIKGDLDRYFEAHHFDTEEADLLDEHAMSKLRAALERRYPDIIAAVQESGDRRFIAEECRDIMQRTLGVGGLAERGWTTKVDARKASASTNTEKKQIALPASTNRDTDELLRLILHEQEVHARRGQNGADTGYAILKSGTAEYADAEEGLGVLFECVLAGNFDNPSFHRARDRYITAGLAYGTDGEPKDGRDTFEILWRLMAVRNAEDGMIDEKAAQKAKDQARVHIENAFRSTTYDRPGVFYTKLKIYLEGLKKNADYFAAHLDSLDEMLDTAMIGKYDHTNPEESRLVRSIAG